MRSPADSVAARPTLLAISLRQRQRRHSRDPTWDVGQCRAYGDEKARSGGTPGRARALWAGAPLSDRRRLCGGAPPRRRARNWEDVEAGDEIQQRVKGPLVTTDVVVWHIGWGMQLTPPGAFGISYGVRKKVPGLYPPNHLNIPDTVQRLHWEPRRAQELGLATSYDYGAMREIWMTHLITDWMGDDAWLYLMRCEHRKFNYIGDTSWITGKVATKRVDNEHHVVDLEMTCTNQRDEVTTLGTATVILPSREHGPVSLPKPPADTLEGLVQSELQRFSIS